MTRPKRILPHEQEAIERQFVLDEALHEITDALPPARARKLALKRWLGDGRDATTKDDDIDQLFSILRRTGAEL